MNEENKDPNVYVVSDYSASGEGRSIMILITRANPRSDLNDFEVEPAFVENTFHPGKLKNTPEERALREFTNIFGSFNATGAEVLDRYEFFHRYENHLPSYLYKMTDPNGEDIPPGFSYHSSLHFNYS